MTDLDHDQAAFDQLLEYLRSARGLDFTGYKPSSIRRRIDKRMRELHVGDYPALQDHLEVHPDEFARLFDSILINVTAFFRDTEAWEHLAAEVVPGLVAISEQRTLRIWSAGCSSGQEAYSIVMLLAEAMGEAAVVERVKVYATDVDEDALTAARAAVYTAEDLEALPDGYRDRYFEPVDGHHQFRPDLRRVVIFGRHDLVRDAPISRLDLLVCRNVLMYFNRETQAQVLRRLHFALRPDGHLFLGRAEMLLTRTALFEPVSLHHRVFRPVVDADLGRPEGRVTARQRPSSIAQAVGLRDAAFESGPTAELVLTADGTVALVNDRCRTMFGLHDHDIGRPLRDLEVSYRPVDLRSHVDRVVEERRPIQLRAVERALGDEATQYLDVLVTPLHEGPDLLGIAVAFTDVTHAEELRARLNRANRDLEASYEELQSTNEELETTNEELQSANEELETTNEELQSANEELETMNEELQSANAQQAEVAAELTSRSGALDRTNTYLEGILASLTSSVIVVDRDFVVTLWSAQAFEDWGLRSDEVVGQSLMKLDCGLPTTDIAELVRVALEGRRDERTVSAVSRRGRDVRCHVVASPLQGDAFPPVDEADGAVLLIEAIALGAPPNRVP